MEEMREELLERFELARGRILELKTEMEAEGPAEVFPKQIPAADADQIGAVKQMLHRPGCMFRKEILSSRY